jgi:hypothetical protein
MQDINITYSEPYIKDKFPDNTFNGISMSSHNEYKDIKNIVKSHDLVFLPLGHGGYIQYVLPKFVLDGASNGKTCAVLAYDTEDFNFTNCERNQYFCKNLLEKYNEVKDKITIFKFNKYFPLMTTVNCEKHIDQLTSWIKDPNKREQESSLYRNRFFGKMYDLMELNDYDPNNSQDLAKQILNNKDSINYLSYKWITDDNLFHSLKDELFDNVFYCLNKLNQYKNKIYMYIGLYGSGNVTGDWYWAEYFVSKVIAKLYPNLVIIGVDGYLHNNKEYKCEIEDHIKFAIN